MSDPVGVTRGAFAGGRALLPLLALGLLALGLLGLGGGWLVRDRLAPVPGPDAVYLALPEVTTVLADRPHLARLGLVLEAAPGQQIGDADMQRMVEEIRRWLAAQSSADLHGAAALWTLRGRMLALARELEPGLGVEDVLIKTLVLQ